MELAPPVGDLQPSVIGAVITASVAVIVAVLTQWQISLRERRQREEDRRRTALLDAQNAAVALRSRLREYGSELRAAVADVPTTGVVDVEAVVDPAVVAARDDADGVLTAYLVRVDDEATRAAILAWRSAANKSFISSAETPASAEDQAWDALNRAVRDALHEVSGKRRRSP